MLAQLQTYATLILAILQYEHRLHEQIEQFKGVVQLVDGSRLHINEVWIQGVLEKYAYYRLSPTDQIIQGWDNAPHHPEINSYPHHLHQQDEVFPSEVRTLSDALEILAEELIR